MSRYGLNNTRTNLDTEHTDATLQILTVYFALQEYCSQVKASLVVFLYLTRPGAGSQGYERDLLVDTASGASGGQW